MPDTPDLSEMLGELTKNPEMMSKVMNMASAIMGNMGGDFKAAAAENNKSEPPTEAEHSEKSEALPKIDSNMLPALLKSLGNMGGEANEGGIKAKSNSKTALLMALKPYMSTQRAERIDMILKAMNLADLAGGLLGNGGLFGGKEGK